MTVTELARLTGYSVSTVSKALSDSAEIGADAKEKILKAAVETGYYQKAVRRKKRIGAPKTVGIACDEYADMRVLRVLSRRLEEEGYKSVISINETASELFEHLGADAVVYYRREPMPSSVPAFIFERDVDELIERLLSGEGEEIGDTAKTSNRKKEDIWLF